MIHHVTLRAFVSATEDQDRVKGALGIFVPLDLIRSSSARGFYGNEIIILEATLKRKEGLAFCRILKEQLSSPDKARLNREAEMRTDEDCQFHLRLDKQAAYQGRVELTDSRDAIDVCAHIATYPARPEEAVRMVRELF